jgi:thymidylate synthase (FAD)
MNRVENEKYAAEIEDARGHISSTRRVTVTALEEILFEICPILDHGFIRVVDYMGDDTAIVQAARVSYGRGTKKVSEDQALINYLMRHHHTTPFEMAEIKLHIKLPIFVARQWIRHRTASVNEYSARYSVLDREFYIPERSSLAVQSRSNRQGRSDRLIYDEATRVLDILKSDSSRNYDNYLLMLNEDALGNKIDPSRDGLARELARMNLTLNAYTQWYWKTNLHNLFNFLRLRVDAHAQFEIRAYADEIVKIVDRWVPACSSAFKEYRLGAKTLSATVVAVLQAKIRGEDTTALASTLGKRERLEISELFPGLFS